VTAARHLVLVGPTASGKSSVAMELARHTTGVEVVSVDSMQVYRGMDIGTAKPTAADQAEVRHHLLDLADPDERFTVSRFAAAAAVALAGIEARGHTAVLVAGTGLYLQAVLGDLHPPGEWPDLRKALEADADTPAMHRRLAQIDPIAAGRIEPTNRRRIIRALEVTEGSGRRFSSFGPGVAAYPVNGRFALVGIAAPRPVTAMRVEERVQAMMSAGLLDEVRGLQPHMGLTARQALGYKELLGHLEDGGPVESAVAAIVTRTRAFSVRQRRWFGRDPRICWYEVATNPLAVVTPLLRQLSQCRP
jgi:tRNA dimethylallyltransferase